MNELRGEEKFVTKSAWVNRWATMGTDKRQKRRISITDKTICKIFFRIMEVYVKYFLNNYYWNVTIKMVVFSLRRDLRILLISEIYIIVTYNFQDIFSFSSSFRSSRWRYVFVQTISFFSSIIYDYLFVSASFKVLRT